MPPEREYPFSQRVVSIGGGTGHFAWCRGVTQLNYPEYNSAIVSTWDSGRVSGEQRVKEGILPPGDYMQCLLGFMEDEDQFREAIIILRDRSEGYPLVNQLAAKSEKAHHGVEGGIDGLKKLFRVRGKIIPVSLDDVDLNAKSINGRIYRKEHEIDAIKDDPDFMQHDEISNIYLDIDARPNPKALKELKDADKIVVTAGSPYTSTFPHLLIRGVPEAIIDSPAKLVVVLNLMTTTGEDHHLSSASRWLLVFRYYLHDDNYLNRTGKSRIDYLLISENHISQKIIDRYRQQGQRPMLIDAQECYKVAPGIQIVKSDIAEFDRQSHLYRHIPDELAKAVLELGIRNPERIMVTSAC